ncbi:MAG: hypothetical protein KDD59_11610 [Bdellovibrionales bacterium]|nr:hypothetical protein [Bdellovibrionales bacterium]
MERYPMLTFFKKRINRPFYANVLSALSLLCVLIVDLSTLGCQLADNRISGRVQNGGSGGIQQVVPLPTEDVVFNDSVSISWNQSPELYAVNIAYLQGLAPPASCAEGTTLSNISSSPFSVAGLLPETTYSFLICTVNNAATAALTVTTLSDVSVSAVYAGASANWNGYVRNNGASIYESDGTPCDGTESISGLLDEVCIHGAEIKLATSSAFGNSCTGLTAQDSLQAFNWVCDDSMGSAQFFSSGLADGKGLKDLVSESGFESLRLTVKANNTPIASSSAATWWSNPVLPLPAASADLDTSGAIYVLNSSRTDVGHAITVDKVSVVIKDDALFTNTGTGFTAASKKYLWFEGHFANSTGTIASVGLSKFVQMRNVTIANLASATGFDIQSSTHIKINNLVVKDISSASYYGVYFNSASSIQITHANLSDSIYPLVFSNSGYVDASYIYGFNNFSHIGKNGGSAAVYARFRHIYLQLGSNGISGFFSNSAEFYDISMINLSSNCFNQSTGNATIVKALLANCGGIGLWFNNNSNRFNTVLDVTIVNAGGKSFKSYDGQDNWLLGSIFSGALIELNSEDGDTFSNVYIDGQYWPQNAANDIKFTDALLTGLSLYCINAGSPPGANSGLDRATCLSTGITDATRIDGLDINSSFVGKVGAPTAFDSITDFTEFGSEFIGWGRNAVSPIAELGDCATGETCQAWDWRLKSTDTILRNTRGDGSSQSPNFVPGATCPAPVHGNLVETNFYAELYLINATEIIDDDVGDDDGLCESNESCVYSPNFGAYQGHGDYLSQGTCLFQNGTVTGVNMYAYPQNGI